MKWLYESNGETVGPVDSAALKSLAVRGEIGPHTLVWKEGTAERVPASRIRGLLPVVDDGVHGARVPRTAAAQEDSTTRGAGVEALGVALAAASAVSAVAFRYHRGLWRMMHAQRYALLVLSLLSGAMILAAPWWLGSEWVHWPLVLIGSVGLLSMLGIFIGDPERPLPGYVQLFVLQLKGSVVLAWGVLYVALNLLDKINLVFKEKVIKSGESWLLTVGIIDLLALLVALLGAFIMFRPLQEGEGE